MRFGSSGRTRTYNLSVNSRQCQRSPMSPRSRSVLKRSHREQLNFGSTGPVNRTHKSWVQNRVQLAPAAPNLPTEWSVAEYRMNSVEVEREIRNQQVAGSIPASGSIPIYKAKQVNQIFERVAPSNLGPNVCQTRATRSELPWKRTH